MTSVSYLNDPDMLEIELTSKCTLSCSECPRVLDHDKDNWNFGEISIEAIERIISVTLAKRIIFCGGYGDPIYHSKLFDIIKICHKYGKGLHIETCGNLRKKEWWQELAQLLKPEDTLNFSVDGLEHNNHLYRKNADWQSIYTAMEVMGKESKCLLFWKWIVFKYNENDIIEGYKLSKKLGIHYFRLVDSTRMPPGYAPTKKLSELISEIQDYKDSQK
jgi:MoaA/NifB/PqqE/SkfB family radical SAM enzyme